MRGKVGFARWDCMGEALTCEKALEERQQSAKAKCAGETRWKVPDFSIGLVIGMICRGGLLCSEPFAEGDGEGEELFVAGSMDHLDVDLGTFERRIVEIFYVVEEIAGEGGVGGDGGGLEAEVVIVLGDFFVDGGMVDGDGGEWDSASLGLRRGEEAAVEVVEGGGGKFVAVGSDELHADLGEVERGVGVVGDDDADGDEGVADVGEAKEVAVVRLGTGIDGDGDVLLGVGVEGGVLGCGEGRGSLFP